MIAGCSKSESSNLTDPDSPGSDSDSSTRQVRFGNSNIAWSSSDELGIFMLSSNGTLANDILMTEEGLLADNIKYISFYNSGKLSPLEGTGICYPISGAVDFIAYYPHRATPNIDPHIYAVDVTEQSNQKEINVLWAKATDKTLDNKSVTFEFERVMSRITLHIVAGDGVTFADIATATVTIEGIPQIAYIDLNTGKTTTSENTIEIVPQPEEIEEGYDASFSAIIPPHMGIAGRTINMKIGAENYSIMIPLDDDFISGRKHVYPITVDAYGISLGEYSIEPWIVDKDSDNIEFALPGIYTAEDLVAFSTQWNAACAQDDYSSRDHAKKAVYTHWSDDGTTAGTIRLRNNIDMSTVANFTPIAYPLNKNSYTYNYAFIGRFDGGGHTISNLKINIEGEHVGLFGVVGYSGREGSVENVILSNCHIKVAGRTVGGIVGYCDHGKVSSCQMLGGLIEASSQSAGIVGYATSASIRNCQVINGNITAETSAGGIVGSAHYSTVCCCQIINSNITSGYYSGGIAGMCQHTTILSCISAPTTLTTTIGIYNGFVVCGSIADTLSTCYRVTGVVAGDPLVGYQEGSLITGCGNFARSGVRASGNFFTTPITSGAHVGKTPIAAMNAALQAAQNNATEKDKSQFAVRWKAGNASSNWWPISYISE
ncbi:fimbrillin family protein [Odoribacter sp. OttesenSCG-928-A06]|nr:fimbrillin family protein [Odoribacter sp. OttesenSCG-928-A06]